MIQGAHWAAKPPTQERSAFESGPYSPLPPADTVLLDEDQLVKLFVEATSLKNNRGEAPPRAHTESSLRELNSMHSIDVECAIWVVPQGRRL